jgi:dihydroorotate dehydrogenase (NAD+) catalytic subunit
VPKPPDLSIDLAGIRLRSPVVTASGCFASGKEASEFVDLKKIGGPRRRRGC